MSIQVIDAVNLAIGLIFMLCYAYQMAYIPVTLFKKDRPHKKEILHRYAVLISARNEEAVIGQLLESIRAQDYPAGLVTVFTVADNCTDMTAEVARAGGATVYERFDKTLVGKGYALDYLLRCIARDFGGDAFDGFFVFDADNLLREDYISRMNRTFSDGYDIVTGYRNSKNYGDNWISAGYALWFLRESEFLNHARMLLGTSCAISGTGFLVSRGIIEKCGGWPFHLLTEDIEFTIHNVTDGERVGYCGDAVLYDEQPVRFDQSWRQRLRWARGYMQVFGKYGTKLLRGVFGRGGFACFDMAMAIMPAIVLTMAGLIANTAGAVISITEGAGFGVPLLMAGKALLNTYLFLLFIGAVTTATQWKLIHATALKKTLYCFTFPLFMMTYIPISLAALFGHVEWKPIEHKVSLSIRELEREAS